MLPCSRSPKERLVLNTAVAVDPGFENIKINYYFQHIEFFDLNTKS